jgi:formylmethanofuran dehydrogenase subunit E
MDLMELLNTTRYLTNNKYLDSVLPVKKSQKFRCKTCGEWHTEQSDKHNVCISCREEWLKENGE